MPKRYWRLIGLTTRARGDLELAELHLYNAGARIDQSAVSFTSTLAPIAGTVADLADGDFGTFTRWSKAALLAGGFALNWDFGATGVEVDLVRPGSSGSDDRYLASAILQSSVDSYSWEVAARFGQYVFPGPFEMAALGVGGVGDALYSTVKLLLRGNGAFTDESAAGLTMTPIAGASIDPTVSKFGGGSIYLDGGGYIQTPPRTDFVIGTQDFCIDFYAKKSSNGPQGYDTVLSTDTANGAGSNGFFLELSSQRGFFIYCADSGFNIVAGVNPNDDAWHHYELSRIAGQARMFIDGELKAQVASTHNIRGGGPLGVGGSSISVSYKFRGHLDDVRFGVGAGRHESNFTPPTEALVGTGTGGLPITEAEPYYFRAAGQIKLPIAYSANALRHVHYGLQRSRDMEFGGNCAIAGFVKEKGTPNVPVRRRVRLLRDRDALLVRETWSNAATGAFLFSGIDGTQAYTAFAQDHTGNFRAVVADRLTAEVPV